MSIYHSFVNFSLDDDVESVTINNFKTDGDYQIRLLWVGYLKNDENENCLFANLPKYIIQKISTFL